MVCFVCCLELMMLYFPNKKRTIFQRDYVCLLIPQETCAALLHFRQSEVVAQLIKHLLQLINLKPNSWRMTYDNTVEDLRAIGNFMWRLLLLWIFLCWCGSNSTWNIRIHISVPSTHTCRERERAICFFFFLNLYILKLVGVNFTRKLMSKLVQEGTCKIFHQLRWGLANTMLHA